MHPLVQVPLPCDNSWLWYL